MADTEQENEDEPRVIGATEYVAPMLRRNAFHCPFCRVYAPQASVRLVFPINGGTRVTEANRTTCLNCRQAMYWLTEGVQEFAGERPDATQLWPLGSSNAPAPHPDFPADPRGDYEEARSIVDRSPRGAVALLRLAVQKLCGALGEPGKNINDDIASLVVKGLTPGVQQALDSLRVIGNNAVHPGTLDLKDDRDTAVALFGLLNFIVEQMITRPNELQAIYSKLPPGAVAAIQHRDGGQQGAS